ncbi:uncharacterized protein C8Q71DRAFT_860162 [Rhodofomes roseus]|uniref:Uncharacterized protein n=1 Tax=Rhodofomes roseus TaxID=34475 RepID=A0ABQ8K9F5_9APHY|nr:uncharacterized protein C8Q71DRAFT_860162 [Rhodofomes roseus]KAH9833893.1 hypothetical protein C8Q71DRAFT_860162 [Rhodofomes roseus]
MTSNTNDMDIDDTSNNNGNMGNRDSAANATDKDMDMDKDVGTSDQDDTSNEESSVDPETVQSLTHSKEGFNPSSDSEGMDATKMPIAPIANGKTMEYAPVFSSSKRSCPAGVVHMSSQPNLSTQAQAIAESPLTSRASGSDSAWLHNKTSKLGLSAVATKPRSRVLLLSAGGGGGAAE